MQDLFYIIEVRPQWYNLIVKDTHYCIGCGSHLDTLLEVIYKYVRKYKTEDRVYNTLRGLSDNGDIAPTTMEKRQKDYISGKHIVFEDLVKDIVIKALKDNRQDTPYHKIKGKVKTTVKTQRTTITTKNEVRVIKRTTPLVIKRTIIPPHK